MVLTRMEGEKIALGCKAARMGQPGQPTLTEDRAYSIFSHENKPQAKHPYLYCPCDQTA